MQANRIRGHHTPPPSAATLQAYPRLRTPYQHRLVTRAADKQQPAHSESVQTPGMPSQSPLQPQHLQRPHSDTSVPTAWKRGDLRFAYLIGPWKVGLLPAVLAGDIGTIPYKYRAGLHSGSHSFDYNLARADSVGTAAQCTLSILGL